MVIVKYAPSTNKKKEDNMFSTRKTNYAYYDIASLRIKEKNIKDNIETYKFLINEPGYKEELANSEAELSLIQQTIAQYQKNERKVEEKKEVIAKPQEQKPDAIIYYNPVNRKFSVQPIFRFTEAQKEIMIKYIEEGDDLDDAATKPLINATIYDEILMEYNFDPGLVVTEGQINSLKFLQDYYKIPHPYIDRNDPTNTPHPIFQKTPTLDLPSTKFDVIPCNTLLRAIQLLLAKAERWKNGDKHEPTVSELKQPKEKRKYTSLTEKEVAILEIIYKCLPPSRQLMFNVIVRDGDEIMNKAVILPDGFVYDASCAEKQLKQVSPLGKFPAIFEGRCPSNAAIPFKVVRDATGQDIYSEIKPALYYDNVIKILKNNAAYFQKVVDVEMKPLNDEVLSTEREVMLFKLSKYLEKIETMPVMRTGNEEENVNLAIVKINQLKVINAAISALKSLDAKMFHDVTKECSSIPEQSYAAVKTKFNGINSGKGFFSKFYRVGAYLTGTIDGQIGVEMPTIVTRIKALLVCCQDSLELKQSPRNTMG